MFNITIWNEAPRAAVKLPDGRWRVTRNVERVEEPGEGGGTVAYYKGEEALMSEAAYAAYIGACGVEVKRKDEIIDDYTMELIEGGVL